MTMTTHRPTVKSVDQARLDAALRAVRWRKEEREAVAAAFAGAGIPLTVATIFEIDDDADALAVTPSQAAARIIRHRQQPG